MSTVIGYILLTVLLLFTLFNIYATATKKKREKFNEAKYNALFAPLEEKIIKNSKEWKDNPTLRIVSDSESGIIIVRDDKRKMCALSWDYGLKIFSFSEYKSSEINEDSTKLTVTLSLEEEDMSFILNSGKYKKKYISSTIKEEAKSMVEFLSKIKG